MKKLGRPRTGNIERIAALESIIEAQKSTIKELQELVVKLLEKGGERNENNHHRNILRNKNVGY